MVIHEDDPPSEVSTVKNSPMEAKKYVIVKNHVRELTTNDENETSSHSNPSSSSETKKNKRPKKKLLVPEIDNKSNSEDTEISQSDLEELRTVYKKCKEVLTKIETKYGHLLDLDQLGTSKWTTNDERYCSANTKIIFDDNGEQIVTESDYHVCPKKKRRLSDYSDNRNIQVEYAENDIALPDDISSLTSMLQDPNTMITLRNAVINKIRTLRQEYANEIRFNKHILIEKSKTDLSEVFDFKGSNLSTLPGYPDWK